MFNKPLFGIVGLADPKGIKEKSMRNVSLKFKVLAGFSVGCLILVLTATLVFIKGNAVKELYRGIGETNFPNIVNLYTMKVSEREAETEVEALIGQKTSPAEAQAAEKVVKRSFETFDRAAKSYESLPFLPGEEKVWRDFKATTWVDFEKTSQDLINLSAGDVQAQTRRDQEGKDSFETLRQKFNKDFSELTAFQENDAQSRMKTARSQNESLEIMTIFIVAVGALILLSLGYILARYLSTNLIRLSEELEGSAQQTTGASEQLTAASQTLSASSTQAAASLEETVASVEEISSMVKTNATNASEASQLSVSSRQVAEKGEGEIHHLLSAMQELSGSARKIEEIISVIDDIAFQTNLLALNASVEAARAGEQGKGFAVVAEAVRGLAQRSAGSAKEIASLIKDNVEKTGQGVQIASRGGDSLKEIVVNVKKVSDINAEIAAASQEQANGIAQISQAMNQLDQATQGNAASSEEVAASSEELSSQAQALLSVVHELRTLVNGAA